MTDSNQTTNPASVNNKKGSFIIKFSTTTMRWVPFFFFTIGIYLLMQTTISDLRSPIINIDSFVLNWVELLYILAAIFSMVELLKVSNPGRNDQKQVNLMYLAAIINIVIFTISITAAALGAENFFNIFATSEFLVLIIFSLTQSLMAGWINAITAQRTIGTGTEF